VYKSPEVVMPLGIGIDIVSINRVKDAIEASGRLFLDKVFTPWEQKRAETCPNPTVYLAMTFAGKEAIFKTFGIDWETGVQLKEIEIRDGQVGQPIPILTGKFAQIASERGVSKVLLSLSYDGEYAIGVAALCAWKED
jgi:phosphopantetheine--protein transferase-like protein